MLYHATYAAYYPSIMRNGLGGVTHHNWYCSTDVVCLAPSDEIALSYAECAPDEGMTPDHIWNSGIVILCVDVDGLLLQDDPNIDDEDDPCLIYDGVIPPSRLSFHSYNPMGDSPLTFDTAQALRD